MTAPADEPGGDGATEDTGSKRQRVERTGRRRARLTPVPGSDPSPETATPGEGEPERPTRGGSPDDDRITRERPPHW